MKYTIIMQPSSKIIHRLGMDARGDVSQHFAASVLHRIAKYMPSSSRMDASTKVKTDKIGPYIETRGPQAKYLFYGTLMVGKISGSAFAQKGESKTDTKRPLIYSKAGHPMAGPRWDKALSAAEGAALAADVQSYLSSKGG